jgi:hypothetical protein
MGSAVKIDYWSILLQAFLPLVIRTFLYLIAFRVRRIHIKLLSCIVIAGAAYLVGVIPIPLPDILRIAISIGLAMFLITRYTEAELFPDVIVIPLIVEVLASLSRTLVTLIPK